MIIKLRELLERDIAWGHEEGHRTYLKLSSIVDTNPSNIVFSISMSGLIHTDTSFSRESVIQMAKKHRGNRGFCLRDIDNEDMIENWDLAARKLNQPITMWAEIDKHRVLGPEPTEGTQEMLEYVLSRPSVTTSESSKALKLKVANSSNKLRVLFEGGFILRRETIAPSGGIEFEYFRIK